MILLTVLVSLARFWALAYLGLDPYVDEVYYWGWAQALDWGYYSKPPMIAALIAASTALFGDTLLAIKLPSLLLYPATALVVFGIGQRLFDARVGLAAGFTFLTLPLVSALSLFASTDAPLLFCWALATWLLVTLLESSPAQGYRLGRWLLLGIVVGLGLLSKYTMAAFVGSAFLVLLALPNGRRALFSPGPWLALLVAGLLFMPNLLWNASHDFPTFRHTAEITRLEERALAPDEFGEFLGAQWISLGLVFGLAFWLVLADVRRLWRNPAYRLLWLLSLPLLALVAVQSLTGRANGNWAAPAFVTCSVWIVAGLMQQGRRRWLAAALAVNLATGAAGYFWNDLLALAGQEPNRRTDIFKRARGWQALADGVAPYWREVLARQPDAVLVAADRETLAQLIYALRPARYASWNPKGELHDHYQLTTRLEPGSTVLLLSKKPEITEIAERFGESIELGKVEVKVNRDFGRQLYLFELRDFRGYAP